MWGQLLVEYLLSRQLDEAAACVKELDCKLFHHEIIKRGVKVKETGVAFEGIISA